jgi:cytosine deaminase
MVAQLDAPFDVWSQTLCRADWLQRTPDAAPTLVGAPADLVLFPDSDIHGWPSRTATRVVLRDGRVVRGQVPRAWTPVATTSLT